MYGHLLTSLAEIVQPAYLLPLTLGAFAGRIGGPVPAILLGIPGTPSAIATTFDGFPMARKGQPGRAVWLGTWASALGGLLGAVFLIGATGPLAAFALRKTAPR